MAKVKNSKTVGRVKFPRVPVPKPTRPHKRKVEPEINLMKALAKALENY